MSFTPMPKDTTIKLCRRVPLSPSYNFTIYQTSRTAQKAMFNSYVTGASTFSSQSYQRAGENKLRIAALADNLYDVNYLFFDNFIAPNTSLKTFYCFVTDVKYINDNTTEITYVVDYMQTYYFDINVPACFVEREHTLSDNLFEHLVPEGLSAGEYNVQATVSVSYPKPDTTVYPANDDNASHMYFLYVPNDKVLDPEGWNVAPPGRITDITDSDVTNSSYAINRGGQVVCCELFYLPIPAITNLTENVSIVIRRLVQIRARIVAVYLVPNKARNYFYQQYQILENSAFTDPNGEQYIPKNKKLYTFPYRSLVVSNNNGQIGHYKWEEFSTRDGSGSAKAEFRIRYSSVPKVSCACNPLHYRRRDEDLDNGVPLEGFQTCAWSEDSFERWWATNDNNTVSGVIGGAVNAGLAIGKGVANVMTGNISGAVGNGLDLVNAAQDIAQTFEKVSDAKDTPDNLYGSLTNNVINFVGNLLGYTFLDMGVHVDVARAIDDYFSMFGYAVSRVKVPNIFAYPESSLRPSWNYVKTRNCIVIPATSTGAKVDADACSKIAAILNAGITFFMSREYVGRYERNNDPRL